VRRPAETPNRSAETHARPADTRSRLAETCQPGTTQSGAARMRALYGSANDATTDTGTPLRAEHMCRVDASDQHPEAIRPAEFASNMQPNYATLK